MRRVRVVQGSGVCKVCGMVRRRYTDVCADVCADVCLYVLVVCAGSDRIWQAPQRPVWA